MTDIIILMLVIAIVAIVACCAYRGNKSVVVKMLYALVTEAERDLGGGTGSLKLAQVVTAIYPKLPTIIKVFITEKTLTRWIEEALATAKETWQKNNKIAAYVEQSTENT